MNEPMKPANRCQPVVLIVLDGWGYSEHTQYNAIHSARKPNWDRIWARYPHTLISASGGDVGLPDDQMGNSEVGHVHIGAGRLVPQELTRIGMAIEDRSFFANPSLAGAFDSAARAGRAVHVFGLLSPGGVHSHEDHLLAAASMAAERGVSDICLHAFLDGRDTPPSSAAQSLAKVQRAFAALGRGRIVSIVGRYYAMDRNKNWGRTRLAWKLLSEGEAEFHATDPLVALDQAYARGETDEFVKPTAIVAAGAETARIRDGDVCVFMNFRADRARQLTRAFTEPGFDAFDRGRVPQLAHFVTLTEYSADLRADVAYPPQQLDNSFGEYVSSLGLKQLRIAETEKYAHVTFFFNGGEERVFPGEDRLLVNSPAVATYDMKPEMSAAEVTDHLVESIASRRYQAIICNFANADMVGHTGVHEAAVKAIETLDTCLGRIEAAARTAGMELLITADHGNAEQMRTPGAKGEPGQPHTAHTSNLVPLVYIGREAEVEPAGGTLVDIAPTLLAIMGLPKPPQMTGHSLVRLDAARIDDAPRRQGARA
ncbi:MAG: 2,3-bisphosphoglycerate-independent phosphoglycerate mutase [Gammaproteobacteria bacterium]